MRMIISEKTGKYLWENRYPLVTKKEGMKVTYSFAPEYRKGATFCDYVRIADHINSIEFAQKMSKKLGEPCRSVIVALRAMTWHNRID